MDHFKLTAGVLEVRPLATSCRLVHVLNQLILKARVSKK